MVDYKKARIAVVGLGYVGLPLAVELGKYRNVVGFDINAKRIEELDGGKDSTREVSEEDLLKANYLRFSSDINSLRSCQIFIVTVPTPVDHVNRPNLLPLKKASNTVGQVLKLGDLVI